MYTFTREDTADKLSISTRSVDRYIRAGKLRAKKIGKIVYIHTEDIENLLWGGKKPEIILPNDMWDADDEVEETQIAVQSTIDIKYIFDELKNEIVRKDDEIKDLHGQLGKMEEVMKNSISLVEYKKSQFLLEESKIGLRSELEATKKNLEDKVHDLKKEKWLNMVLVIVCAVILLLLIVVWIVKI